MKIKKRIIFLSVFMLISIIFVLVVDIDKSEMKFTEIIMGWGVWLFLFCAYSILTENIIIQVNKNNLWIRLIFLVNYFLQLAICYLYVCYGERHWKIIEKKILIGLIIVEFVNLLIIELRVGDKNQWKVAIDQSALKKILYLRIDGKYVDTQKINNAQKCILNNLSLIFLFFFLLLGNLLGCLPDDKKSILNVFTIINIVAFGVLNLYKYKLSGINKKRFIFDMIMSSITFCYLKKYVFVTLSIYFPDLLLGLYGLTPFLITFLTIFKDYDISV